MSSSRLRVPVNCHATQENSAQYRTKFDVECGSNCDLVLLLADRSGFKAHRDRTQAPVCYSSAGRGFVCTPATEAAAPRLYWMECETYRGYEIMTEPNGGC